MKKHESNDPLGAPLYSRWISYAKKAPAGLIESGVDREAKSALLSATYGCAPYGIKYGVISALANLTR